MRKSIAERMMNSLQTSAQVTLHRKVDISRLIAFRQDMKDKVASPLENGEISITTLLTKAVAKGRGLAYMTLNSLYIFVPGFEW